MKQKLTFVLDKNDYCIATIGTNFHGAYIWRIKNWAVIHDFIFVNGPIPTIYYQTNRLCV